MKVLSVVVALLFGTLAFAGNPRMDILDTARSAGNFKTLLTALEVTGLDKALDAHGSFTVLAPTDEAFSKLPEGTLEYLVANPEILKGILLYHVASAKLNASTVLSRSGVATLSGKFVPARTEGGKVFLAGAEVIAADIMATNGIIHVLDSVLVPNDKTPLNVPQTVSSVDPVKYMGLWYEIARYPQSFQQNCGATTAQYTLLKSGKVGVKNSCRRVNGEGVKVANAIAKIVNKETNAQLKVSFVPVLKYFGFFGGDYWILALGENYEYALVGGPDRQSLWILSRTPEISEALYNKLVEVAVSQGFDPGKLVKSPVWK